jgi:hypothetical protein
VGLKPRPPPLIASLVTDEWLNYDANGRNTDLDQSTPNSGGYYHTTVSYWANNTAEYRDRRSCHN